MGQRKKLTLVNWFTISAGLILAVTGIAKIWSGLGSSKYLELVDPIIGLKFEHLMLAIGTLEIIIALFCLITRRHTQQLGLIAWISTSFLIYRLSLWGIDWHSPCSCVGNLTDALQISPQVADNIMKGVLAFLLIGSYGILIWQWRQSRSQKSEVRIQSPEA